MSCETIDELLAAYAVDALSRDEIDAVDAHLAGCRTHDQALAGLRAVTDSLAAVADVAPPPELRSRLLRAFDAQVAARAQPPRRLGLRWLLPSPRPAALALAAALVLALGGLLSWNLALQFGGDGGGGAVVSAQLAGEGSGRLVYLPDEGLAVLDLQLPNLGPGRDYQAWGVFDGETVSLGLVAHDGATVLNADLRTANAVAISEEPAGGSPQPTSDPLAVAQLSTN